MKTNPVGGFTNKGCLKSAAFVLANVLLGSGSLLAQTSIYIMSPTFETDAQMTGIHPADSAWQISDGSTSQTGGISEFNYNGSPSPQGGNYVYGPYQGAGNLVDGIYNFTATTGAGTVFADASAAPFSSWVDGEQYEIIYWFRPVEVRNIMDNSVWAMTFSNDLVFQKFSADGVTTTSDLLTLPISTTGWTEFRVPITYDADFWDNGSPLFFASPQFSGWTQIGGPPGGFQPNLGSPSAIFSIAIDTGVPVPEPSTALLMGLTVASSLRRRRSSKIGQALQGGPIT